MARPGLIGAGVVAFTLTLTDYALPDNILGGGTSDVIANAIYDACFQISGAGLGAALAALLVVLVVLLVLLGSTLVGLWFAAVGAGTTSLLRERG